MGGTTAKGALVKGGEPLKMYDMEVARVHEFKRGSGLPVKIPVIDMIEIGAGGGSIAEVDERGVIRVGPMSAGAEPGPACYGQGGERATLTDANLLLGYLDPGFFLGGEFALDVDAADGVLNADVAAPLSLDAARAAWGVHEVINEDVARAFRIHASERGFDYRSSSMVAFGGSGPVHALAIARKLRIPRVVFPIGAGVMSALGLLVSPLGFEIARSRRLFLEDLDAAAFADNFSSLEAEACGFLDRAGVPEEAVTVIRRIDMRYQGQGYEIEVTLPAGETPGEVFAGLEELFRARYAEVFAETFLEEPLEIVTWKVEAKGPEADLEGAHRLEGTGEAADGDAGLGGQGRQAGLFRRRLRRLHGLRPLSAGPGRGDRRPRHGRGAGKYLRHRSGRPGASRRSPQPDRGTGCRLTGRPWGSHGASSARPAVNSSPPSPPRTSDRSTSTARPASTRATSPRSATAASRSRNSPRCPAFPTRPSSRMWRCSPAVSRFRAVRARRRGSAKWRTSRRRSESIFPRWLESKRPDIWMGAMCWRSAATT